MLNLRTAIDLRPVFFVLGLLLVTLALLMLLPAVIGFMKGVDGLVFVGSTGFVLFSGVLMVLSTRGTIEALTQREAFLITALAWSVIPAFAALPLYFASSQLSYNDAYFEAMSGLTTTGSTIITALHEQSHAVLFWRSSLQWLGGIGVVVMALSVLPFLKVGGMQLFRIEFAGKGDRVTPRAIELLGFITGIYSAITICCFILYWIAGMAPFQALNHAMTTVATGGFSTHDQSIGHYNNIMIEMIAIIFMLLGSVPFLLYIQAIKGSLKSFVDDAQIRGLLLFISTACVVMWVYLVFEHDFNGLNALRLVAFNVTSIMTGTGYVTVGYDLWGVFAIIVFLFVMFVGGCAGSTTCGIKIFRIQVLFAIAKNQMHRLILPNAVLVTHYAQKPLPESVGESVMGFFFLFIATFVVSACALGLTGLDFITAVSGAATAIANVGPGLGETIGPNSNFGNLPTSAKWVLSVTMLLGRLEIFAVLVLFSRKFWIR